MIRCEVEQTSEDFIGPGKKLADNLTHLTTGKAMKPLRHWFRSTPWLQDFFFLKSTKCGVFIPLDVCLSLYTRILFSFSHFLSCLLLQHLLCSSSRDRDGKTAKDEKGKNFYL